MATEKLKVSTTNTAASTNVSANSSANTNTLTSNTADNRYRKLLDNLTTGVILLDEKLKLNYINLAAESQLAVSGRKVLNSSFGELFIDAEEDIEEIKSAQKIESSFTKRNTTLHLFHGKHIQVDYTITHINEMDQAKLLMEIQPLNHAHKISREQALISTRETTRELVRGLAHEIKNPLGGIRGAAQLLADELPNEELAEYTNVIIEEADRLHNLVDRLIGSRKLPEIKALNIHEVLERVRSVVQAEIADTRIQLIRDYDPSIPEIQGDSEQLIQALLNITRNAVQALSSPETEEGKGKITLKTRVVRNATIGPVFHKLLIRVEIIDNGPGIPSDLIDNIFYPMISGRADGTGLGLSIAHAIISHHKGNIECNTEPQHTTFTISLPFVEDSISSG